MLPLIQPVIASRSEVRVSAASLGFDFPHYLFLREFFFQHVLSLVTCKSIVGLQDVMMTTSIVALKEDWIVY